MTGTDIWKPSCSSGESLWHQRAVNWPRCVMKAVISCACSRVQKPLVIASVTEGCEGCITETHKQLIHIHQSRGREQALSHFFPPSPSVFHTFAFMVAVNKARYTHIYTCTHRPTHAQICYLGMYMTELLWVKPVCIKPVVMQTLNSQANSLPLHFWTVLDVPGNYYSWVKLYRNLHKQCGAAVLTTKTFMDRSCD